MQKYQEDEFDLLCLSGGLGIFFFPEGKGLGQGSAFSCHLIFISFKF
jgi:hypothetical protein